MQFLLKKNVVNVLLKVSRCSDLTILLAGCLLLLCLCWHIAAFVGALPPPIDQRNSVKRLAELSPACTCVFVLVCVHEKKPT